MNPDLCTLQATWLADRGFGRPITVLEMAALEETGTTQDDEADGPGWEVPLSREERRVIAKVLDAARPRPALEAGSDDDDEAESLTAERSTPIWAAKSGDQR
jgi:hypothetical protein